MSNPFRSIGKVFKKVMKSTIGKIIVGALMVGAVVLTAGAAIPALGTALGMSGGIAATLGLSGTLGSIVAGAVSMGAVGAITGGLAGMASGKGFFKGATGGFLMGAAAGGIMGGVGLLGAGGLFGGAGAGAGASAAGAATGATGSFTAGSTAAALQAGAVAPAATGSAMFGAMPSLSPAVTSAMSMAPAATGAGAGIGGGLLKTMGPQLLQMGGQIVSGFAQGKAAQAEIDAKRQEERDDYDRIAFNYGYKNIYANKTDGTPTSQEAWGKFAPLNLGQPNPSGLLSAFRRSGSGAPYQIVNGQVVQTGAA